MVAGSLPVDDAGEQPAKVPRDVGDAHEPFAGRMPLHVLQLRAQDLRRIAIQLIGNIGGMHRHQGFINECCELVSSGLGHEGKSR
jgi:hypothetical protein